MTTKLRSRPAQATMRMRPRSQSIGAGPTRAPPPSHLLGRVPTERTHRHEDAVEECGDESKGLDSTRWARRERRGYDFTPSDPPPVPGLNKRVPAGPSLLVWHGSQVTVVRADGHRKAGETDCSRIGVVPRAAAASRPGSGTMTCNRRARCPETSQ